MFEIVMVADASGIADVQAVAWQIHDHVADVMDHLVEVAANDQRLSDPDFTVDLAIGRVEISVAVDVDDMRDALSIGRAAVRSAIHAAGGATPGWDGEIRWSVSVDDEDEDSLATC